MTFVKKDETKGDGISAPAEPTPTEAPKAPKAPKAPTPTAKPWKVAKAEDGTTNLVNKTGRTVCVPDADVERLIEKGFKKA